MNNTDILKEFKAIAQQPQNQYEFTEIIASTKIDLSVFPPKPKEVLRLNGGIWGTMGNFTVVTGKAKSKKTFLITAAVAAAVGAKVVINNIEGRLPAGSKIIWFDTEQGKYHITKAARRAVEIAGLAPDTVNMEVYALRQIKTAYRLQFIDDMISNNKGIKLVVIDGIRDILNDINSPEEAMRISDYLLRWTENKDNDLHIICVLHTNKTDGNLRGHIGTELLNKSETVIDVSLDEKNKDVSIVSCERSRNMPFDEFAFTIDPETVLPQSCDIPAKDDRKKVRPKNLSDDAHQEMIKAIWEENTPFAQSDLIPEVVYQLEDKGWQVGQKIAREFVKYWERKKWIINKKNGRKYQYISVFVSGK